MIEAGMEFVTTVPAGGYQLIRLSDYYIIDQFPVLAFLVYRSDGGDGEWLTFVLPVTTAGVHGGSEDDYALMRPGGMIHWPTEGSDYNSLAELRSELEVYREEAKARVA